jgi:cytochrome c oxidase subunit 3
MSGTQSGAKLHYFVPQPSHWPITGSCALLLMAVGAASWFNSYAVGPWLLLAGFALLVTMMFGWFGTVIGESEHHLYNKRVDHSFRWGMSWFIFSEVMFFAAFFGALFYVRNLSVPWLGDMDNKLLWPNYVAAWPTNGPYLRELFTPMAAIGIPLLNTIILVSSGGTLTVAHHALLAGRRGALKFWLFVTIVLGFMLLGFQEDGYTHAYSGLHMRLSMVVSSRSRPSVDRFPRPSCDDRGIMLTVMLLRVFRGHFDAQHHFAFEAAAWYWHFVDVVWLLLFVLVYWL